MDQHALATVITVCTILLSIIGTLIIVLGKLVWGSLKAIEERMDKYEGNCTHFRTNTDAHFEARIEQVVNKFDVQIQQRTQKHDDLAVRVFEKVDETKDKLNDLCETVAGFSGIYITRQELLDFKTQFQNAG